MPLYPDPELAVLSARYRICRCSPVTFLTASRFPLENGVEGRGAVAPVRTSARRAQHHANATSRPLLAQRQPGPRSGRAAGPPPRRYCVPAPAGPGASQCVGRVGARRKECPANDKKREAKSLRVCFHDGQDRGRCGEQRQNDCAPAHRSPRRSKPPWQAAASPRPPPWAGSRGRLASASLNPSSPPTAAPAAPAAVPGR